MKKLLIATLVVLGSTAIAGNTIKDHRCYDYMRKNAGEDWFYEELSQELLRVHPDLLSWQDEKAGHGPLLFAFIGAGNRNVFIPLIRDILHEKIYYNDKTGQQAIDEILPHIEDEDIAQMIVTIAKENGITVDRKKKSDLRRSRTQSGWFSAKKLLGGSLILGAVYGGWSLYKYYYQSENEKK